jgi:hypothetical protein
MTTHDMPASSTVSANALHDPIHALIAAHDAAVRDVETALSIPEDAKELRDREEARTGDALATAEDLLAGCNPQTLAGAVAALRYFVAPESGLLDGVEERHARYLSVMVGRLSELIGPAH